MSEDLSALPLPEADRVVRERIEHHREQMGYWRRVRAERIAAERAGGLSVAQIADALGVHQQVVYELLRAAGKVAT